jgi:hypothetical protein
VAITISLLVFFSRFNSFSIGILLVVAVMGLYHLLAVHRRTISLDLGLLFSVVGGVLLTLMLAVQHATRAYPRSVGAVASEELARGLTSIHLGIDIAWDVFITVGLILMCLSMLGHPRFGWLWGGTGILLEVLALVFNIYTFPDNPDLHGLFDVGPLAALWLLIVFLQMLRSARWALEQPSTGGA